MIKTKSMVTIKGVSISREVSDLLEKKSESGNKDIGSIVEAALLDYLKNDLDDCMCVACGSYYVVKT